MFSQTAANDVESKILSHLKLHSFYWRVKNKLFVILPASKLILHKIYVVESKLCER